MPSDPSPDEGFWVLVSRDGTRCGTNRFATSAEAWAHVLAIHKKLEDGHALEPATYAKLEVPVVAQIVGGRLVLDDDSDVSYL